MIKDGAARGLSSVEVISDTRIFASTSLECCGIVPFAVRGLWMLDAWTGQCGCAEDGSDERTCMHACMHAPCTSLFPRIDPNPPRSPTASHSQQFDRLDRCMGAPRRVSTDRVGVLLAPMIITHAPGFDSLLGATTRQLI